MKVNVERKSLHIYYQTWKQIYFPPAGAPQESLLGFNLYWYVSQEETWLTRFLKQIEIALCHFIIENSQIMFDILDNSASSQV